MRTLHFTMGFIIGCFTGMVIFAVVLGCMLR